MGFRTISRHVQHMTRRALWRVGLRLGVAKLRRREALFVIKPWLASEPDMAIAERLARYGTQDDLRALALRRAPSLDAPLMVRVIDRFPDLAHLMVDLVGPRLADIPQIETVWEGAWKSSIKPECMDLVESFLVHLAASSADPDRMLAKLQCGHNPWRLDVLLEQGPQLVAQAGGQPRHLLGALGRQAVRVAVREHNTAPLERWIAVAKSWEGRMDLRRGGLLDMYHDGAWSPALMGWCAEWRSANQYVRTPDIEALGLLLKAGAEVNVREEQGYYLLERLMLDFEQKKRFSRWVEERISFNTVTSMLVCHGMDWLKVRQDIRKECPLTWEALGHIPQVRQQRLNVIGGWGRGIPMPEERRRM